MATAKITLIGFNNYYEHLWDFLYVPDGINKEILINNILMKGGEFEVLYSNPEFMKDMIGVWSHKWKHTMERWVKAISINYEPLENYDRREEWTDSFLKNEKLNSTQNDMLKEKTERSESATGHDESESSGSGTTTNTRSSFDSATYQPHDQSESYTGGTNESDSETTANGNIDVTSNNQKVLNNNINETSNNKRVGRAHGNIGVTTSQQMLESELQIAKWNLYDEVADLFLSEFCIYTY